MRSVFIFCDNQRVMSAEKNGFIHVWRAEDGEGLLSLIGPVDLLQLSPSSLLGISANKGDSRWGELLVGTQTACWFDGGFVKRVKACAGVLRNAGNRDWISGEMPRLKPRTSSFVLL